MQSSRAISPRGATNSTFALSNSLRGCGPSEEETFRPLLWQKGGRHPGAYPVGLPEESRRKKERGGEVEGERYKKRRGIPRVAQVGRSRGWDGDGSCFEKQRELFGVNGHIIIGGRLW